MERSRKSKVIQRMKWRKVLYGDQSYPDNYRYPNFLKEKTVNKFVVLYSYGQLVSSSVVLTQQLCVVCIFVLSWWFMSEASAVPLTILTVSLIFSCFGYVAYMKINQVPFAQNRVAGDIKTAVLLLSFTAFFSPVLKTLTHTISTDTVYAMTTFMLLGHFLFHDYDTEAKFASRSVSLNMSVFAAICLASRLDATFHTFVTVTLAFQLFGLWPILRRSLWKYKPRVLQYIVVIMTFLVFLCFLRINVISSGIFLLVMSLITSVFPAILVSMQKYKNNIHGPWDEAIIQDE